eukprot:TRINITY_DN73870_c0_g1_i1.p1 TRINITY_DN73870_c0_g1~~TRINITY_DN73870_c0_g1_i1.p1  ORF type:complete len:617 (+),score=78.23 TRINITY_DN73870_c0_g1_i1:375-2225(+)
MELSDCRQSTASPAIRFALVPDSSGWHEGFQLSGIGGVHCINWGSGDELPSPPCDGCWLLPTSPDAALGIARQSCGLRAAGWRVLTSADSVVERMTNKVIFQEHAVRFGLSHHLPEHYATIEQAHYPCVLKSVDGNVGKKMVFMVQSAAETRDRMGQDGLLGTEWVLQEFVCGPVEINVSLLVQGGKVVDGVAVEYSAKDGCDSFLGLHQEKHNLARSSFSPVPREQLNVLEAFLSAFSGICSFHYKLRSPGDSCSSSVAILKCNPCVSFSFAVDADRRLAASLLERLDAPANSATPSVEIVVSSSSCLATTSDSAAKLPAAAATVATPLVYLSAQKSETPRYSAAREAPGWLRSDLTSKEGKHNFLLRGARSPALEVHEPRAITRCDVCCGKESSPTLRPAVVVCPGGGYEHLNPREGGAAADWLAGIGVVAFVLRYRVFPADPWPAALDDIQAALALLASPSSSSQWQVDPSRLGVLGFSAGAHLAAQAIFPGLRAAVLVYPAAADAGDVPTTLRAREAAALAAAGTACSEVSPPGEKSSIVCPSSVPAYYVVASTNDRLVPPQEHADLVVNELRECGLTCEYHRAKLGAHGFGVQRKWTLPASVWLRRQLDLA